MLRFGLVQGLRHSALLARNVAPKPLHQLRAASTLSRYPPLQRSSPTLFAIQRLAQQKRGAASSVSGKPASSDVEHLVQNAKEEAKGVVGDVAKIIAAANFTKESHSFDGFSDITTGLAATVPKPILLTGLAGAIPYIGTAASTLYFAREAGLLAAGHAARVDYDTAMTALEAAAHVQVTYGAVILSFLGALHWGMEFVGYGGQQGYKRLALGVAPVVFAWTTLTLDPSMALITQWAGFTGLWYADMRATALGWTPVWYSQYRFYLSILIGTCILVTLWGQTWFNPVQEDSMLAAGGGNQIKGAQVDPSDDEGRVTGTMATLGDIETVEGESHYVILKKKAEEGAAEEETEEEGEAKAESSDGEEDSKDATGGDQDGDAKEHVEEVTKKQEGKEES
ncbi:hypothetical protein FRB94_000227 [Tulasnella sp. JGI-2019a]|nr:hypothetical protein FRB94_000227 [Tulasnella sp. JGI-2019a]KAG9015316.1 hypothetical protein FRB93_013016 [Tulasnella sp. JGI-2019a]KAG9039380.1 hypothetical protein FRB95_010668 [Tulasnella sp. JGI-2019a]